MRLKQAFLDAVERTRPTRDLSTAVRAQWLGRYRPCKSRTRGRVVRAVPSRSASAAEPDDRTQDQPGERPDQKRYGGGRDDDYAGKGRVSADVTDSLDDTVATHRADRKAGEITAEHEAGEDCVEVFERHTQGDEGSKKCVCELNAACCDDERSDLSAFRLHPFARSANCRT